MNGLVVSNGPAEDFKLVFVFRFVGELARDMLFIPDMSEGVKGVLASERVRCLLGVFGMVDMVLGHGVRAENTSSMTENSTRKITWSCSLYGPDFWSSFRRAS